MTAGEWIALAALIFTIIASTITGLVVLVNQFSSLKEGIIGVKKEQADQHKTIRRLFELWDSRKCDSHSTQLDNLTKQHCALQKRTVKLESHLPILGQ